MDKPHSILPVALGTATYGTSIPASTATHLLDSFAGLGGRDLDTANNYAFWHADGRGGDSEAVLGAWLQTQDRAAFCVTTKVGSMPSRRDKDSTHLEGLSATAIRRAVDECLQRLGTIDVLLAHHDDPATPLLETWRTFTELVQEGKVGQVGISNYRAPRVRELADVIDRHGLAPIAAVQMKYSLLDAVAGADFGVLVVLDAEVRQVLQDCTPEARLYGYGPLMGGLFEADAHQPLPASFDTASNHAQMLSVRARAAEAGVSAAAVVLQQVVADGIIPVTSTQHRERLASNLALLMS